MFQTLPLLQLSNTCILWKYRILFLLIALTTLAAFAKLQRYSYGINTKIPFIKFKSVNLTNSRNDTISNNIHNRKDSRLRIALIKPDAVLGLYHSGYGDEDNLIQKAAAHWGPIGLFHPEYFSTDYYIVLTDHEDPSTTQWAEPLIDCNFGIYVNKSKQIKVPPRPAQGYYVRGIHRTTFINITKLAVYPTSIPWHIYDIVLSYSPAVSKDIISKYPSTIWAYWIVEGCQRSYSQSRKGRLVDGWDLFLTQDFNLFSLLPQNVVEFPLTFDYHGGLADILRRRIHNQTYNLIRNTSYDNNNYARRSGILLLPSYLSDEERRFLENITYFNKRENKTKSISLTYLQGTTPYSMNLHLEKKYAVMWNRTSRGNALGEAWSGGLLVLGHIHNRVINQEIVRMTECECNDVLQLIQKIIELDRNEDLYLTYLSRQKKLFDGLAFYGPLRDLLNKGLDVVDKRLSKLRPNAKTTANRLFERPVNIFTTWH